MEGGRWIWKHSFSGEYTVKSGYDMAYRWKMAKERTLGDDSNWVQKEIIWNKLWKSKVPEGVKLVAWKAFFNALPVFRNLLRKGVGEQSSCQLCGYKMESVEHTFRECWWAKSLWSSIGIDIDLRENSLSNWLWGVLERGKEEEIKMVLVGIHMIWRNRNLVAHGEKGWDVLHCKFKILCLLAQTEKRSLLGFNEVWPSEPVAMESWEVFCDGSWSREQRNGGWAAVIKVNGVIMECRTGFSGETVSGIQAEVNALITGLQLTEKYRSNASAIIYSDCIAAVWMLQRGEGPRCIAPEGLLLSL